MHKKQQQQQQKEQEEIVNKTWNGLLNSNLNIQKVQLEFFKILTQQKQNKNKQTKQKQNKKKSKVHSKVNGKQISI